MLEKMAEWSVAIQVNEGENQSGDHYLICWASNRVLIAVVDGLGHGPEAALASRTAITALEANTNQSLVSLFSTCHKALHNTRGVVMSLASFDGSERSMSWLGVGNVDGRLLRATTDKTTGYSEEELFKYRGVVGYELPSSLAFSVLPIMKGDVLILATDGIRSDFTKDVHIGKSAYYIAHDILAKHSKGIDDALVLVAKYRGGEL